ncbi:GNAT family N-acetyltransferase [Rhodobacteraceae bacterium RKSG542]|uniref:GNAT family N-acetyltransferase n=1 Tax=Pseudovibrio flavus TaxID=2529854 RepID=UPI0012BCA94C|nr:GNAT family N-acetyltransferase [Pseudovibrio flavus]MTI18241.1 GNAT family N-acetyltransferase [Pseudovibrio flavus]
MQIRPINAEQTLPLRHKVLWPDKPMDFSRVEGDETASHWGLFIDTEIVAVASVFTANNTARLRKFAIHADYQRQGYGTKIIQFILEALRTEGVETFWCDAREEAAPFYERLGMTISPQRFFKSGQAYFKATIDL